MALLCIFSCLPLFQNLANDMLLRLVKCGGKRFSSFESQGLEGLNNSHLEFFMVRVKIFFFMFSSGFLPFFLVVGGFCVQSHCGGFITLNLLS